MKTHTQKIFDGLEAKGVIIKNGEMRPDDRGVPQPVYVLMCHYDKATPEQLATYRREVKRLRLHGTPMISAILEQMSKD